jgi:hypothetical protein
MIQLLFLNYSFFFMIQLLFLNYTSTLNNFVIPGKKKKPYIQGLVR